MKTERKVTVLIERGTDGTFGAYIETNPLPYGIIGDGDTAKDAISDFMNSYDEMKAFYKETGKEFVEAEFDFKYDMTSFLSYYSDRLSLAGLERITGVNQGQLSHYMTGHRNPSKRTVEKIETSLHKFAEELMEVQFH